MLEATLAESGLSRSLSDFFKFCWDILWGCLLDNAINDTPVLRILQILKLKMVSSLRFYTFSSYQRMLSKYCSSFFRRDNMMITNLLFVITGTSVAGCDRTRKLWITASRKRRLYNYTSMSGTFRTTDFC